MRWITQISLDNYRAFRGQYNPIEIPARHHLLIYGENGSGKSSVFNAVKDFFQSSADAAMRFEVNLFSQIAGTDEGAIKLKVSDLSTAGLLPVEYMFAKPDPLSTHRVPAIQLANKVKGFLDYKNVLETYFGKTRPGQNPNLFSLVIKDLLADHLINRAGGGVATYPLRDEWERLRKPFYEKDRRYKAHRDAVAELPAFEGILQTLLIEVFTVFRRFITDYFDPKLDIDVTLSTMAVDYRQWKIREELFLNIKYAEQPIASYETFLNEARLSAIGISIYLAALKTYPLAATDLKVLYLDDVFIGLDTNNRLPLMRIIKNEFINEGFQVFISTYDRNWFETSRSWFDAEKCSFKYIELFANDDDGNPTTPDIPIIVDPSQNQFEKARAHFEKRDYPAAGNYLRKACEEELIRILPQNLQLDINHDTGEIKRITVLKKLYDKFVGYAGTNSLNLIPFNHFNFYKKIVFNPFSHNDLEAPHYRNEILDGISLVNEFKKIKVKEIVSATESVAKPMKLGMRDTTTAVMHHYQIKVLENLRIIQQDALPLQLSVVECAITESAVTRKFPSLQAAFDQLWIERGYPGATNNSDFYTNTKLTNTVRLVDQMIF